MVVVICCLHPSIAEKEKGHQENEKKGNFFCPKGKIGRYLRLNHIFVLPLFQRFSPHEPNLTQA